LEVVIETHLKVNSITLKDGLKSVLIKPREIVWVEADAPYVKIHSESGITYIRSTLKAILDELPMNMFVQIHRSYAVNRDKISQISRTKVTVNQRQFPVSRTYKEEVQEIGHS